MPVELYTENQRAWAEAQDAWGKAIFKAKREQNRLRRITTWICSRTNAPKRNAILDNPGNSVAAKAAYD